MASRFTYPNRETRHGLSKILKNLLRQGKGILVIDEGPNTMGRHFKKFGIKNTEENRRQFREILFSSDSRLHEMISGVVIHNEAVDQKTNCGTQFPHFIRDHGMVPGIRVNIGCTPIYGSPEETVIQGLDYLEERFSILRDEGISFAKCRAPIHIGRHLPTPLAIHENAECLARCASVCQANCMVPVLQPEVLPNGDHDILACQKVTETYLAGVIKALWERHVSMEHVIFNPNMIIPGRRCKNKKETSFEMIAKRTCRSLSRLVPPAVPGICFSSSGMSEEEVTVALNKIAKCKAIKPWYVSFGYGRGLQPSVMKTWCGETKNVKEAKMEFIKRVEACVSAVYGKYEEGSVRGAASNFHFYDEDNKF